MNKIESLTLDLFVYYYTEGLKRNEDIPEIFNNYWSQLQKKLQQNYSLEKSKDSKQLNFKNTISSAVEGHYIWKKFNDSDCLWFSYTLKQQIEFNDIASKISEIKDLAILPVGDNLPSEKYLGQTWMISGYQISANLSASDSEYESIADEVYKKLDQERYEYKQKGVFLDTTVYEIWQENIHVVVSLFPEQQKIDKASEYYDIWRELFCCRHKIMWAYKNGRKLKTSLLKKYKDGLEENSNLDDLSKKDLPEIKEELTKNIKSMKNYVREINVLAIQQHTLEINLYNYEIILKNLKDELNNNNNEFLVKFRDIVNDTYKVQLDKDYQSLNPGLAILENLTATIRGMVEIEQAQRDRQINTSIAIAGVGLATSQIASAVIIAQQNPPKNVPFYQTQAMWYSIGAGAIASFTFWIILSLLIKIVHRFRS